MKKLTKNQKVTFERVGMLLTLCVVLAIIFLLFNYPQIAINMAHKHAEETVYPEYAIGITSQTIHHGDTVKGIASELSEEFKEQGYDISARDIYWIIRDLNEMKFLAEADCIEAGKRLKVPYVYECGIWYTTE